MFKIKVNLQAYVKVTMSTRGESFPIIKVLPLLHLSTPK